MALLDRKKHSAAIAAEVAAFWVGTEYIGWFRCDLTQRPDCLLIVYPCTHTRRILLPGLACLSQQGCVDPNPDQILFIWVYSLRGGEGVGSRQGQVDSARRGSGSRERGT